MCKRKACVVCYLYSSTGSSEHGLIQKELICGGKTTNWRNRSRSVYSNGFKLHMVG